jgi:predicted transcriptional regulator
VSDKSELSDDLSDKSVLKDKIAKELSDKPKMSDRLSDILSDIFVMACSNDFITTSAVAAELSLDARSVRRYITRLVDYGYLVAEGGNKNKKYRRANN